jgi:hypothetical protein
MGVVLGPLTQHSEWKGGVGPLCPTMYICCSQYSIKINIALVFNGTKDCSAKWPTLLRKIFLQFQLLYTQNCIYEEEPEVKIIYKITSQKKVI